MATGGSRVCAVLACTGDEFQTCGHRFTEYQENSTSLFEELSIVATVPTPVLLSNLTAHDSAFFPVSLDVSIMPLEPEGFTYNTDTQGTTTVYTLKLNNNTAELYTFAVWGRLFGLDDQEATPPLPDSSNVSVLSTSLTIGLIVMCFCNFE